MMLKLFARSHRRAIIRALYGVIVAQARAPGFYTGYGVPDTVEGRFDMIVLHLLLLLRRLRSEPDAIRRLGQEVFDLFCTDMDHSLREIGIGDLAVPKHMRRLGEAFYGRAAAYDRALASSRNEELVAALARNVFSGAASGPGSPDRVRPAPRRLAAYVRATESSLAGQEGAAIARAELSWPDLHTISMTGAMTGVAASLSATP